MIKNKKIIASILLFIMMAMPFMNLKVNAEEKTIEQQFYEGVAAILEEKTNKEAVKKANIESSFDAKNGKMKIVYVGNDEKQIKDFQKTISGTGFFVSVQEIIKKYTDPNSPIQLLELNIGDQTLTSQQFEAAKQDIYILAQIIPLQIVNQLGGKKGNNALIKEVSDKEITFDFTIAPKDNLEDKKKIELNPTFYSLNEEKEKANQEVDKLKNLTPEEKEKAKKEIEDVKPTVDSIDEIKNKIEELREEDAEKEALNIAKKEALDEIKKAGLESKENTEKIEAGKTPEEVKTTKEEILKKAALETAKQKALEELEKEGITTEEATEEIVGAGTEEEVEEIKNKLIKDKKAEDLADAKAKALKEIKDKKVSKEVLEKAMSEINDAKFIEEVEKLKAKYLKEEKGAKTPKTGSNIVLAGVVFAIAAVSMYKIKNEK